ncbi:helix-turn-helix transcriptional regulator [Methanolapillus millepedarum]|uniref:HTH cro/C1-type domain-containing protein n=1 Tax=Methanolapillus millepedarum TaxID=3028296 RepID=A0AA96V1C4_9EURY|nr:hypothetical protein MsAc7_01460 [Methanosarcinaceae archaeon Ac7]
MGNKAEDNPFLQSLSAGMKKEDYSLSPKFSIPEYVKAQRKKTKMTQVDLAEKAGVGLRFVRDMEQGKETLRMDKVNQVLRLFGSELGPVPLDRSRWFK